ncbi:MAG: hypothetical protein WC522_06760 [Candidatus Omnitrophota bacterium]
MCTFLVNDLAWAQPSSGYTSSNTTTLAAQLRSKPFFDKWGMDFRTGFTASYAAVELRNLFIAGDVREGQIARLNKTCFPAGEVEIGASIEKGSLTSGKKWAIATFNFKKEGKQVKALLLRDYADFTPQDLEELRNFEIKTDADIAHLSCPGLEGVWFVNPDKTQTEEDYKEKFSKVRDLVWNTYHKLMNAKKSIYLSDPIEFLEDMASELKVEGTVLIPDYELLGIANKYFNIGDGVINIPRKVYDEWISDGQTRDDLKKLGIWGPGVYIIYSPLAFTLLRERTGNRQMICGVLHEFLELLCYDNEICDLKFEYVFHHACLEIIEEELKFARDLGCLEDIIASRRGADFEQIKHRYKGVTFKPIIDRYEKLLATAENGELFTGANSSAPVASQNPGVMARGEAHAKRLPGPKLPGAEPPSGRHNYKPDQPEDTPSDENPLPIPKPPISYAELNAQQATRSSASSGATKDDRIKVLEERLNHILSRDKRAPLLGLDMDETTISITSLMSDKENEPIVNAIIAYLEEGGYIAFDTLATKETFYWRALDHLANKLHKLHKSYLLSHIYLILAARDKFFKEKRIYEYEDTRGYRLIHEDNYGTKGSALVWLAEHLNSKVSLVAFYGDRYDERLNDGNVIGMPGIPIAVNAGRDLANSEIGLMMSGNMTEGFYSKPSKEQRIFNTKHGGTSILLNDLVFLTGKLREHPEFKGTPLESQPQLEGKDVVWTFESGKVLDIGPEDRVRVTVGEPSKGAPGFVWAGIKDDFGHWNNCRMIPLIENTAGRHEAVLPKDVNVFTFFWTAGHWESRDFNINRCKSGTPLVQQNITKDMREAETIATVSIEIARMIHDNGFGTILLFGDSAVLPTMLLETAWKHLYGNKNMPLIYLVNHDDKRALLGGGLTASAQNEKLRQVMGLDNRTFNEIKSKKFIVVDDYIGTGTKRYAIDLLLQNVGFGQPAYYCFFTAKPYSGTLEKNNLSRVTSVGSCDYEFMNLFPHIAANYGYAIRRGQVKGVSLTGLEMYVNNIIRTIESAPVLLVAEGKELKPLPKDLGGGYPIDIIQNLIREASKLEKDEQRAEIVRIAGLARGSIEASVYTLKEFIASLTAMPYHAEICRAVTEAMSGEALKEFNAVASASGGAAANRDETAKRKKITEAILNASWVKCYYEGFLWEPQELQDYLVWLRKFLSGEDCISTEEIDEVYALPEEEVLRLADVYMHDITSINKRPVRDLRESFLSPTKGCEDLYQYFPEWNKDMIIFWRALEILSRRSDIAIYQPKDDKWFLRYLDDELRQCSVERREAYAHRLELRAAIPQPEESSRALRQLAQKLRDSNSVLSKTITISDQPLGLSEVLSSSGTPAKSEATSSTRQQTGQADVAPVRQSTQGEGIAKLREKLAARTLSPQEEADSDLDKADADKIHAENLQNTPVIANNTIRCDIITDSIIPEAQRPILTNVEFDMRRRDYSEKIVRLAGDGPGNFVDKVRIKMQKTLDYYRAEYGNDFKNYKFEFGVACPSTDEVRAILGSNLAKELGADIKAMAFERCKEPVQVEGIMRAMRALHTNSIASLRSAFESLANRKLTDEELRIADIGEFVMTIAFILPPIRQVDYAHVMEVNHIIRKYIKTAA